MESGVWGAPWFRGPLGGGLRQSYCRESCCGVTEAEFITELQDARRMLHAKGLETEPQLEFTKNTLYKNWGWGAGKWLTCLAGMPQALSSVPMASKIDKCKVMLMGCV